MPGSTTNLPVSPSTSPIDDCVVELGRLLASQSASRADVARAAQRIPGFAQRVVARVDALQRGANWRGDLDDALARLGFRRTGELLTEFIVGAPRR